MAKIDISIFPQVCALKLIRGYQVLLSPFFGGYCRFDPTCSQYSLDVINQFGVLKGGWLSLIRLLKCHPFHPGGKDSALDK